jgi:hypothetical protein
VIPAELLELPQWVTWKYEKRKDKKGNEKITKVPYSAKSARRASSTDPATWGTHAEALAGVEKHQRDGIGFVFAKSGLHAGVDLDKCRNAETGEIEPWAHEIIVRLNSYSEASPSGTGIHIYLRAIIKGAGRKQGDIEMYDDGRFFTVTGDHIAGTPLTVEDRQLELDKWHAEVFPPKTETAKPQNSPQPTGLDDAALLQKAMAAKNGDKFRALWEGDYSAYSGTGAGGQQVDGRSEADLALCNMLYFWTGGNSEHIDRLFRQSGLMRDKWDERRGEGSYGARTIQKVIDRGGETYTPSGGKNDQVAFLTKVATAEAQGDPFAPDIEPPGIYVEHASYYIDRPKKEKGEVVDWIPEKLTNWIWTPTLELRWPNGSTGERGHLLINGVRHFEIELPAVAWNSRRDLLEVIGRYGAVCFTNNSTDIAKIRQSIVLKFANLPIANGVLSFGLHKIDDEWVGLYADTTLCESPHPPIFYAGVQDRSGGALYGFPAGHPPDELETAKTGIIESLRLMTEDSAMAILGYGAASAFGRRLTDLLKNKLPFVYIEGQRESGKSSYATLALRMFVGNGSARFRAATKLTKYQYEATYSNANNLLGVLDEYKESEENDLEKMLKPHHDLTIVRKGTGKSDTLDAYHYNAPLIVLGEGLPTDPAAKSRAAIYFPKKSDRGDEETYNQIVDLPLEAYAHHLHVLAKEMGDEELKAIYSKARDLSRRATNLTNNPRLMMALSYIAFGLLILQKDVDDAVFNSERIVSTLVSGAQNFLEGGTEAKTNLEAFLEQFAFALSTLNPLQHENYFSVAANGIQIVLRVSPAVELVKKVYRERSAISAGGVLTRAAREAPFFDSGDTHRTIHDGKNSRGLKLDLTAVPPKCDAGLLVKFYEEMKQRQEERNKNRERYGY